MALFSLFATRPAAARALRVGVTVGSLIGTALLAGCKRAEPPPPEPRTVVAATVTPASAATSRLPAVVQARFSTPLSFRVGGLLIERRVYVGDTVKRQKVLARLDDTDARKNAAASRAAADAAQHRLVFAQAQRVRDAAQAKEALISTLQMEQTDDAYATARSQYEQSRQQAALSDDQLRYQTLIADHDGVITEERADTGQVVSAGQAVFTLAWSGPRDAVADVAENQLAGLRVGDPAKVSIAALPGKTFDAKVREIAPAADAQSRTFRVKLAFDHDDPAIKLGMTADVLLQAQASTNAENADGSTGPRVSIPATALFHKGQDTAVWVIDAASGAVSLRPVSVASFGERSIIVSKGLASGEHVVAQGVHAVTEGEKVRTVAAIGTRP